jgi:polysaccharide pyruvyl transferase WcaK-like protein
MKVTIINQCSTNKGDRALLYSVLRELSHNNINNVTVSTSKPEYWEKKPDIPNIAVTFVPWGTGKSRKADSGITGKVIHKIRVLFRKNIKFPLVRKAFLESKRPWYLKFLCEKNFYKAIQQADFVISTGGHHITTIIAKSMTTPQVFEMMVTLICRKPLLLWSQSIGTFDFKCKKNEEMVKKILSEAHSIFIRDEASEEEIKKLGLNLNNIYKTYESVFALYDIIESKKLPSQRPAVMGLSVWTGNKSDPEVRQRYTNSLAELVSHAAEKGYKTIFFPMELEGYDIPYLEAIAKKADKKGWCEIVRDWPDTLEHLNAISKCRIFVGHKTHSQIFSLTAATPLLAIAYHIKTNDFMAQFGLSEYCIGDINITGPKLIEIFDKINANLDEIFKKQQQTGEKIGKQTKTDFAKMILNLGRIADK